MYSWVKPHTLIAVHGETRHINAHVKYALGQQVSNAIPGRNGSLIQLAPGDPRYIGELEYGRLIVDGNDLITRNSEVLKQRQKMMSEHIGTGHRYPSISINTSYSFGIDDQEQVVSFETDYPEDFLDLVEEMRSQKARAYTERDVPIITCIPVSYTHLTLPTKA